MNLHPTPCSTHGCRYVAARKCFVCNDEVCGSCHKARVYRGSIVRICKSPACGFALNEVVLRDAEDAFNREVAS